MKSISRILAVLILALSCFPAFTTSAAGETSGKNEMRGLWVATVLNIDYPSKPTTDSEALKSEALEVLDYAKDTGFNAVFLQVRPAADALYKSAYFPWSSYLTGTQGLAPDNDFDPLAFWIEEAHKRGIQLHAWLNPYRITKNPSDASALDPSNPAVLHPDWVVKYSDGNLYFNPGIPEVRNLIINGVLEIINNYDVDGIHLDDYFYPGKDFNDKGTYNTPGNAYNNIGDWRRACVTSLVSDLSKAIRAASQKVSFGISPFGIWANKGTNPLGSDTKGMQSYYDHYADTRKWVKEGLLDYIAPQLYWNIGYSVADYSKLLPWWEDTVKGTGVKLYIGQAGYLAGNSSQSSPWYGLKEMERQLLLNAKTPQVNGSIFFNYKAMADDPGLAALVKTVFEQRDGAIATKPVSITRPSSDITTSFQQFYLNGSSDPNKPLFLNGQEITNRSGQGYYGILVPLSKGENIFTVSQEGSYATRVIFCNTGSSIPAKMSSVEIPTSSVFPQKQEYRMPGEEITLTCQAPVGSIVSVKIGGKSYSMTPSTTASDGSGMYAATFSCIYTIPSYSGLPRNIDLGKPVYTMNYKGIKKSVAAMARVGVIMKNSPFYAKVKNPVIDTYQAPVSGNGAAYELYKGMIDYVTGMTGNYTRLSSGQWVINNDVTTYNSRYRLKPAAKSASYIKGDKWDTFKINISSSIAATASFDGNLLKLDISSLSTAPLPVLPGDSLFSSIISKRSDNAVEYILTLKDNEAIDGYYVEKTSTGLSLKIKRPIKANTTGKPLSGITIMLDPGHGGSETGAIGPLLDYCEKEINLKTALKLKTELEKSGAKILMTRTTDKTVSLSERLADSRSARPDMFISIHANSQEDNVDMTQISGFSVFYREALAGPLAETLYNNVIKTLNRNAMGVQTRNFYVTRGTWTPSILVETGFVPNPGEFEWLTDENEQTLLARSIKDAVINYFS